MTESRTQRTETIYAKLKENRQQPTDCPQEMSTCSVMELELRQMIWVVTRLAQVMDHIDDQLASIDYKLYKLANAIDEDLQ